jgi:hypothetical protein
MKRYIFIVIAISLIGILPICAQEKPTIDELFCWFPSGSYSFLNHADLERARAGKGWEIAQSLREGMELISNYNTMNWLPASFWESCTSYTFAEPLRVKVHKSAFEDLAQGIHKRPFTFNRARLCVYRLDSIPDLVKVALETNEISDTGVIFRGFKIYGYGGISFKGERTDMFAADAFGLEWLVAEDIDSLKLMIATGLQLNPSILEDEEMADFADIIPDLGETWLISLRLPVSELQREQYLRRGYTEEDLQDWFEEDLQQPVYQFQTGYYADGYTQKEIGWYVDEERAQQGKWFMGSGKPPVDAIEAEYRRLLEERREVEVVGNLRIVTTVYDDKLVEAEIKHGRAQAERWLKEQEAKKAEKK